MVDALHAAYSIRNTSTAAKELVTCVIVCGVSEAKIASRSLFFRKLCKKNGTNNSCPT